MLVTGALIYFISLQMTTSVFVTNMASMIGIGVAIDYSLFILARYREEREAGREQGEARAEALSTSGLAVTFSGLAVIISLAGLWMVDNQALRSMALGAMTVVAVSILTATTLLPALIAMLGDRVLPGGVVGRVERFFKPRASSAAGRPARGPTGAEPLLGALDGAGDGAAVDRGDRRHRGAALPRDPAALAHTGTQALGQFPKGSDVRVGNELASAAARRRHRPDPDRRRLRRRRRRAEQRAAVAGFVRELEATPGVSSVAPPAFAGDSVLIQATPSAPSESDAAVGAGRPAARHRRPGSRAGAASPSVDVGGETARSHDVRDQISGSMWKIILFVLALSFLVLMVMLRSLLLPLKAVLMNLLSIGAAFGVLVAIFQWGWLDGLLGFESQGALDTINVPLIFAVVFGLSMDYEVFLMSRIRERYMRARRQRARGRRGPLLQRPHDLLGGADHDLGLRRLRPHRRPLDQGAGPRLRGRDRPRRDPGAADPRSRRR